LRRASPGSPGVPSRGLHESRPACRHSGHHRGPQPLHERAQLERQTSPHRWRRKKGRRSKRRSRPRRTTGLPRERASRWSKRRLSRWTSSERRKGTAASRSHPPGEARARHRTHQASGPRPFRSSDARTCWTLAITRNQSRSCEASPLLGWTTTSSRWARPRAALRAKIESEPTRRRRRREAVEWSVRALEAPDGKRSPRGLTSRRPRNAVRIGVSSE
jgi:hypothetical protein